MKYLSQTILQNQLKTTLKINGNKLELTGTSNFKCYCKVIVSPVNFYIRNFINSIQDRGRRDPLPVFPLQLLQTSELTHKTFWLLDLTLLPHWCKVSSLDLVPVPNYWTPTKATPQKKRFFLVKSLWNWGCDNFSHRNSTVTKL